MNIPLERTGCTIMVPLGTINEYFADQFPLRDAFVSLKALAELSLFKGENNGVLLGENETLGVRTFSIFKDRLNRIENMDHFYNQSVVKQLEALIKKYLHITD